MCVYGGGGRGGGGGGGGWVLAEWLVGCEWRVVKDGWVVVGGGRRTNCWPSWWASTCKWRNTKYVGIFLRLAGSLVMLPLVVGFHTHMTEQYRNGPTRPPNGQHADIGAPRQTTADCVSHAARMVNH